MIYRAAWYCACLLLFAAEASAGGTVYGTVRFQGDPPLIKKSANTIDMSTCGQEAISESLLIGQRNAIQNAVVSIEGPVEGAKAFVKPEGGFVIDQKKCQFVPHILIVEKGAPIRVFNSDDILHNFRTVSRINPPMSRAQLKSDSPLTVQFDKPEYIEVKCDVHPWMRGWIVEAIHPYYVVSAADGTYQINDIPAGDYNFVMWHEVLGTQTKRVQVHEGERVNLDYMVTSHRP